MPRLLPTVLVVALLGCTAAAFAVTEELKLKPAPITGTQVDKIFSPVCRCPTRIAHIRFRLVRKAELVVAIEHDGKVVRVLEQGKLYGRGPKHFEWNGRDAGGRVVADGSYDPSVKVGGQTIALPNPIVVDTVRPRVAAVAATLRRVLRVRYRLSDRAHPVLFLGRRRVVYGRWQRPVGTLTYRPPAGKLGPFRFGAQDAAGNLSRLVPLRLPQ